MKGISLIVVLVALVQWSSGFSVLDRNTANLQIATSPVYSFSSSSGSSARSSSSSSSSSYLPTTSFSYSYGSGSCCSLDSWAHDNLNVIKEFARRLSQAYNSVSFGSTGGYSYTTWPESITSLTGKSSVELDTICRRQAEQLVTDIRNGLVTSNDINRDNFFEWKANNILKKNIVSLNVNGNDLLSSIQFPTDLSTSFIDSFKNKIPSLFPTTTTRSTGGSGVVVSGSQTHKKWVNGELVSDIERPFVYVNDWKQIEHNNLKKFLVENNLNLDAFVDRYFKDYQKWQQWSSKYNVQPTEIGEWLRGEIKEFEGEGLFSEVSADVIKSLDNLIRQRVKVDAWQTELRDKLIKLIKQNEFTVEQFHKWLLQDHTRLVAFASQYDIDIDEIKNWLDHEEPQFASIGLFKPKYTLNNWQAYVRSQLEYITRRQYPSIEELQQAVKDLKLFEKCSRDYQMPAEVVETWINKELARLLEEGELKINHLTGWQMVLMQRVYNLLKQNRPLTLHELEQELKKDGDLLARIAFKYHTTVEDIKKWVESEVNLWELQQSNTNWLDELRRICEQQYIIKLNIIESQKHHMVNEFNVYAQDTNNELKTKNQDLDTNLNLYVKEFNSLQRDELDIELTLTELQRKKDTLLNQLLKKSNLNLGNVHDLLLQDENTLVSLTKMYSVYINKVEELFRNKIIELDYQKLLNELNKEREHSVINDRKSQAAVEDLEFKVKIYHRQLAQLQGDYKVKLYEIQNWLEYVKNKDLDNLNELLMSTINQYNNLVADNYLEVEELSRKLIKVNKRLNEFAKLYNIKLSEITTNADNELQESYARLSNVNTHLDKLSWQLEKELLDISKSVKYLTTNELESKIRYAKDVQAAYQNHLEEKRIIVSNVKELQKQYSSKFVELKTFESNWKVEHNQILEEITRRVDDYSKRVETRSVEFLKRLNHCHKAFSLTNQRENDISQEFDTKETDLNTWLQSKLFRLNEIIELLNSERNRVEQICTKHLNSDLNVEEQIAEDHSHLQSMANKHHISSEELELWERQLLKRLLEAQHKSQNEVWQQKLRKLLSNILLENEATLQDFRLILDLTQNNHNFGASSEIHELIKQEIAQLQSQGLVKNEELNEWQKSTRDQIVAFLKNNWSVDEVERKLLSQTESNENEAWIKKTCKLLQGLSQLKWQSNNNYLTVEGVHQVNAGKSFHEESVQQKHDYGQHLLPAFGGQLQTDVHYIQLKSEPKSHALLDSLTNVWSSL